MLFLLQHWQIPAALKPVYHWFNIPASFESRAESTEVDGTLHWMTAYHGDNPLHHIRTVAAREDFVVLKLDVDDPEREVRWVQQLLSDQGRSLSLLDQDCAAVQLEVASGFPSRFSDIMTLTHCQWLCQ